MLEQDKIISILNRSGILLKGHFLLSSGKHTDTYIDLSKLFNNPKYSEPLCKQLAEHFKNDKIDAVIGHCVSGAKMAYAVSRHLKAENYFTENEDGIVIIRRGFSIKPKMRCLVVDDVIVTDELVLEICQLLKNAGATVVGVGSIIDRTDGKSNFGLPYKSVASIKIEAWDSEDCPICDEGKIMLSNPDGVKVPAIQKLNGDMNE